MAIVKKMMTVFICERCEHEWVPRDPEKPPIVCPSCKNPYWQRPRENPTPAKKTRRRKTPG